MKTVLRVAALGVSVACVASLAPVQSNASSHREAPLIAGTPGLDNTDLYAFVSPDAPETVTVVANWQPFEEPNGGPNFYTFAEKTAYDINIDNNGDAKADITYRYTFRTSYRNAGTFLYNTGPVTSLSDGDLNLRQSYSLDRITSAGTKKVLKTARVAPSFTGKASMPNYATVSDEAVTSAGGGVTSFAGQADDPFFADLRVFDLLYGGDLSEVGQDSLRGYNVNSIALRVPKADLALKGNVSRNPVVGIWSTTSRIGASMKGKPGKLQQVSRLGMPLVNEAVIPAGRKNEFNASVPTGDTKFLSHVTSPEIPKLIEAIYKIPAPATPRKDLVEVFLTGVCKDCGPIAADLNSQLLNKDVVKKSFRPSEQLRLNMAVAPAENPNRFGVIGGDLAGFPNGRRLTDDVIDVTLQAAEGILLPDPPAAVKTLGDGVDANSAGFRSHFPYVALPNEVSVNQQ
ncbi:DUF4331 domain-containing protein [Actinoplanes derwentensis]|uniref:DUF4331 domain-containing protein n=1 Tax=Actinoplanes derwentensis TaxID=113562 RepID=A0A1H2DGE9_9ACTN|nr:DUF4331 domain-containing protein [Actinoplanes derwentensis]SDT81316.1 protein of unknown function [Actinoplanes derwentensis]